MWIIYWCFLLRNEVLRKNSGFRSKKNKTFSHRNIRFFIGNKTLHHGSSSLHLADTVSITFEFQKRDTKNDVITHHKMNDKLLCPVKIWGKFVHRIYHYTSSNPNTTVNTYRFEDGSLLLFTGTQLLKRLQLAASTIGPDSLGFTADKICLHSACSGAAMAMYLAGVPVFTIMLLGRWSSDAFLRYIRKQVKEFSTGISQKMIIHEHFSQSQLVQLRILEMRIILSITLRNKFMAEISRMLSCL